MRGAAVLLLVTLGGAGCVFHADYEGGHYTCSDGVCPSGFSCVSGQCVEPRHDAAIDGMADSLVDARPAALTCADPGPFPTVGGMTAGTTAARSNTVTSSCGGSVMNGTDAVYRVDAAASVHLLISVTGSFAVSAYVIAPCSISPATPVCIGNTAATPGNPINVTTTFAGQYFVVVDSANAAASGTYTLSVDVQ